MKKAILINPAFNVSKENYDSSISVGRLSIATYLDSKGVAVEIIDGVRQKNYLDLVKEEINDCGWAGISVMTTQIGGALDISRIIKNLKPDCRIVWGGSHPSFFPEQTADHLLVDFVCVGEGEIPFYELVSGKPPREIDGITFKENGGIRKNPTGVLHDPAKMPLFNWDLMPREILEKLHLVPSLTSRGCPHRCTFCINSILECKWRPRTAGQVLKDLEIIGQKDYFQGKKLRFWDENFFVDMNRAREIINGIISKKLIRPWETTVRCNYLREGMIDDEFLEKLKESGCYLLSFGAESGCPRILTKIKKDIMPEDVLRSAEMSLRHDIIPQYSFMIGLPGEAKSEMLESLRLIDNLIFLSDKVQILGPQAFRPYPGSPLYEECLASGWRSPKTLDEWAVFIGNELNYLNIQNYPWVKDKDFVESMEAYVRFGAHSVKSALGSSVKAGKFLKLGFILLCKLRWKLKFFVFPFEFKLAKKFVVK